MSPVYPLPYLEDLTDVLIHRLGVTEQLQPRIGLTVLSAMPSTTGASLARVISQMGRKLLVEGKSSPRELLLLLTDRLRCGKLSGIMLDWGLTKLS